MGLRRALCILVALLSFAAVRAQKLSVASFRYDPTDITANTSPNIRFDLNGEKCALIKVETDLGGLTFDVGALGITAVEQPDSVHPAEVWLFVPHGVKYISVQRQGFSGIDRYDLGSSLGRAKTYRLSLTTDRVNTQILDYARECTLRISVQPKSARFYLNGVEQRLNSDGVFVARLAAGIHNYRVTDPLYHPADGQVTVRESADPQTLNVNLTPAYGYLSVVGSSVADADARVSVDGVYVGNMPLSAAKVASGRHTVSIRKPHCLPLEQEITVTDLGNVSVAPMFERDYSEVPVAPKNPQPVELATPVVNEVPEITVPKTCYVRSNEFYLLAGIAPSKLMTAQFGFGFFASKFNIEAAYVMGVKNSGSIYWNDITGANAPVEAVYRPEGAHIKAGFGLRLGRRCRLTPQLGCFFFRLKETLPEGGDPVLEKPSAAVATFGLRFNVMLGKAFALYLSPEYGRAVSRSEGYKALSSVSPKINDLANSAFRFSVGLNICM